MQEQKTILDIDTKGRILAKRRKQNTPIISINLFK